ncbi:hypothetical protein B0T17DRAFT_7411 [Bombardia bombarda]|uniref:Uncharacterized protein n=1 Tax=Bombardia bombarda TaxID=252184 RepID=A0AA39XI69_9PEZI|nr:hypothetical protein B0T17DRAFT_7411 [Bombardia bombarda]
MRSIWSCSSCVVLLLFAIYGGEAAASHAGRERKDIIHRIAKAQVTGVPLRRDEDGTCATDYTACPASLSGGCCPSRYACATDSCYATTAGPTTACGKANYFACPATDSGGCCPVGYLCGPIQCELPAGLQNTLTSCPNDYFLCPASLNYGCCKNGMGCALNACYSTEPVTTTIYRPVTTTSDGHTITSTKTAVTVATPTAPTNLPVSDLNVAAKFIPSTVTKLPMTSSQSGSGGGLTNAQLGGIIAAVVILLIIVITATAVIYRRLNRVQDAVESKKGSTTDPQTKSRSHAQMEHYGRQLHNSPSEPDNMSNDPFITPNSNTSAANTPQIGGLAGQVRRGRSDSDNSAMQNGYPLGTSIDGSGNLRYASPDSNVGYFDLPARVQNMPGGRQPMRTSTDSHATHGQQGQFSYHWRQQSNASELSGDGSEHGGGPGSPLAVTELDGSGAYVELPVIDQDGGRSRSSSVTASPRPSLGHNRQRSGSNGPRVEAPTSAPGFGPLGVVSEEIIHGYYGPRDRQAGQTSVGMGVELDLSSPTVGRALQGPPGSLPSLRGPRPPQ